MFFSDFVTLRKITYSVDAEGYSIETVVHTTVWANKVSVTRSEFYAANKNDINVSAVFEIHAEEYGDQEELQYGAKYYDVIRTYQKGLGLIELVCSDKAA